MYLHDAILQDDTRRSVLKYYKKDRGKTAHVVTCWSFINPKSQTLQATAILLCFHVRLPVFPLYNPCSLLWRIALKIYILPSANKLCMRIFVISIKLKLAERGECILKPSWIEWHSMVVKMRKNKTIKDIFTLFSWNIQVLNTKV